MNNTSNLEKTKKYHLSVWEYLQQQNENQKNCFPNDYIPPEKITAKSYEELPSYYQNMLSDLNDNINYYNRSAFHKKEDAKKWIWAFAVVGSVLFLTTGPLTGLGFGLIAAAQKQAADTEFYESHIKALTDLKEEYPELKQSKEDQEKINSCQTWQTIYLTAFAIALLVSGALMHKDYKNYPTSTLIAGTALFAYQLAENNAKRKIRQAKARIIPKNVRRAYWQDFIREA